MSLPYLLMTLLRPVTGYFLVRGPCACLYRRESPKMVANLSVEVCAAARAHSTHFWQFLMPRVSARLQTGCSMICVTPRVSTKRSDNRGNDRAASYPAVPQVGPSAPAGETRPRRTPDYVDALIGIPFPAEPAVNVVPLVLKRAADK
jgi:hypothetical protein